jgi:hypothetical protein
MYQYLNADSTAVLDTATRRCIYLDQPPTIHSEAFAKWRDGWTEVIPARREVITPARDEVKPAWIEKVGNEYVEHPEKTIHHDEVAINHPEQTIVHEPHEPDPYVAPPAPPPAPPVKVITMRKARRALHGAGLLDAVEAAVAAADKTVQIDWDTATEVERDWPALITMQAALGLTDAQIDDLFIQASQL